MTEPKNTDARIQRTYDQLLQALTELLTEKTFDEVRVKDICERAGVHRSTFYDHFEDKYHLLTFGVQELMDILVVALPNNDEASYRHVITRIFKYFLKNKQEYSLLFLDPRNASAKAIFQEEFTRALKGLYKSAHTGESMVDVNLRCHFFTGGLFSVLCWWLENDTQIPLPQIAGRFAQLFSLGLTTPPKKGSGISPIAWN